MAAFSTCPSALLRAIHSACASDSPTHLVSSLTCGFEPRKHHGKNSDSPKVTGSNGSAIPRENTARNRINTQLIAEHWDDMLRLAGSLKLGVVQAMSVMRTLQIGDRPTKLAQAVAEVGRIDKTIQCLTFVDDEAKRRRTLAQLNRGEDRHKLARAVFHGKRGELRQLYREGQEDQLGALGLVVNVIILWNTLYINAALDQLAAEGRQIDPDDVARLSPLVFSHINLLGRYAFAVPEAVSRGELRPLPNPADALDDVA
jgi:hypothetical protein